VTAPACAGCHEPAVFGHLAPCPLAVRDGAAEARQAARSTAVGRLRDAVGLMAPGGIVLPRLGAGIRCDGQTTEYRDGPDDPWRAEPCPGGEAGR